MIITIFECGYVAAVTLIDQLADTRIEQAIARGELDDLPGQGKPLQLDDEGMVPEEFRMAYRILKNAGMVPPEITLKGQINALEKTLTLIENDIEHDRMRKKLQCLYLKLDNRHGRRINLALQEEYYRKLMHKL